MPDSSGLNGVQLFSWSFRAQDYRRALTACIRTPHAAGGRPLHYHGNFFAAPSASFSAGYIVVVALSTVDHDEGALSSDVSLSCCVASCLCSVNSHNCAEGHRVFIAEIFKARNQRRTSVLIVARWRLENPSSSATLCEQIHAPEGDLLCCLALSSPIGILPTTHPAARHSAGLSLLPGGLLLSLCYQSLSVSGTRPRLQALRLSDTHGITPHSMVVLTGRTSGPCPRMYLGEKSLTGIAQDASRRLRR